MKAQHLLSLLFAFTLLPLAEATVVVNFDGNAGVVTSGINWGDNSYTTLQTTTLTDDTVRSILPYGTELATSGVGTYSGPTMKGGAYMNSIFDTAGQNVATTALWGQIINKTPPEGDYIQMRRNNQTNVGSQLATGTTRAVFTFATGGSYSLDGSSEFSLMGGIGSATSDIGRWVVVSGGVTYISESSFDPANNNNTTVYTFSDPDTTHWAAWVPDSDLGNVPDFTTTVAGSTLTAITEAGFFFDKAGNTNQNPTFRVFTADLSTGGAPAVAPVGVAVAIVGEDVQLTFDSIDGQSYRLLLSTDDMASFAPVAGATDTGDGNPLTFTHIGGAPASGTKAFYQIEAN